MSKRKRKRESIEENFYRCKLKEHILIDDKYVVWIVEEGG